MAGVFAGCSRLLPGGAGRDMVVRREAQRKGTWRAQHSDEEMMRAECANNAN